MSAPDPRLDAIIVAAEEAIIRRAEDGYDINDDLAAAQQLALIHNLRVSETDANTARDFHYRAACAARDQLDRLAMVVGSLGRQPDTPPELAAELTRLSDRVEDWLSLRVPSEYRIHPVSRLRPPDCQWPDGYVPPEWDGIADGVIERAEDGYDEPRDDDRHLPLPASGPFADPGYIAECEYDAGGGL